MFNPFMSTPQLLLIHTGMTIHAYNLNAQLLVLENFSHSSPKFHVLLTSFYVFLRMVLTFNHNILPTKAGIIRFVNQMITAALTIASVLGVYALKK